MGSALHIVTKYHACQTVLDFKRPFRGEVKKDKKEKKEWKVWKRWKEMDRRKTLQK